MLALEPSHRGVRILSRLGELVVRGSRRVRDLWQRSIQLRVIAATLALSLVVVGLLGTTMLRQISDGLLQSKTDSAIAEASIGFERVQEQLDAANPEEPNSTNLFGMITERASSGSIGSETLYEVVLIGTDPGLINFTSTNDPNLTGEDLYASIPQVLRDHVAEDTRVASIYTSIPSEFGDDIPAYAVGAQIEAPGDELYGLYYVFLLTDTQDAIDVVTTAVASAGVLLVVLLGTLAWLVTRQVVTPVRVAARIAGRFSAGELSERMAARGKDDIAKLAASFNQMASSLQLQIGQLEELSRVQQQFVSDVSHELRTPITTVRMAADVLYETKEDFDPAVQRSIELLQTQLDRFEALLTDLLEISRFDAGAAVLHAEPQDIRDIVHDVVDAASPLAAQKGSDVLLDLPDEPCVAELDARRVERVLRNLVVNAIEHGEGRDVLVRVAADDEAVAVAVRDYGVGLKPGESSLVFHRFWRADPARARTTGGTGLGLSISLEDARLHGGWLQAWGEPGEGSQFRLTLPRHAGGELTSSPLPVVPPDSTPAWSRAAPVGEPYLRVGGDAASEAKRHE